MKTHIQILELLYNLKAHYHSIIVNKVIEFGKVSQHEVKCIDEYDGVKLTHTYTFHKYEQATGFSINVDVNGYTFTFSKKSCSLQIIPKGSTPDISKNNLLYCLSFNDADGSEVTIPEHYLNGSQKLPDTYTKLLNDFYDAYGEYLLPLIDSDCTTSHKDY